MTDRVSSPCAGRLSDADFCSFAGNTVYPSDWQEKRGAIRYPLEEPVILETEQGEMVGAVVINYGRHGLYFESDFLAAKGTVLKIRNESALSMPCQGGCKAQVRWTHKIGREDSDYHYGTGVEYC